MAPPAPLPGAAEASSCSGWVGSPPSSARNAATVSSAAVVFRDIRRAAIAGGAARHTVWQRTQRTERPFAPIAASAI